MRTRFRQRPGLGGATPIQYSVIRLKFFPEGNPSAVDESSAVSLRAGSLLAQGLEGADDRALAAVGFEEGLLFEAGIGAAGGQVGDGPH